MTDDSPPPNAVTALTSRTHFPTTLRSTDRWMVWKATPEGRKVPRAPQTGDVERYASAMDPDNWMSFEKASDYTEKVTSLTGLTYTLQDDDGLTLMDYDDVRDPETGEVLSVVMEHVERVGGFAQVSTSGTGIHIITQGSLPEAMSELVIDLPGDEDAELEIYDGSRFIAMTGDVLDSSSDDVCDGQELLDDLVDEHATETDLEDAAERAEQWEPSKDREEIEDTDTTSNIEDIFDAIKHTTYRDIRLRSTLTEGESTSRKSFDPSWEQSDSGTRLGYENGGWIYRKGNVGLDALQVVALEERIISSVNEYPEGDDFWDAVEALRDRGAHIPTFEYDPEADGRAEAEPTGTLPLARLDRLSHDQRRRYASYRDIEWPDVEEVRERLQANIVRSVREGGYTVLSAPTGAGKTHGVATKPWKAHPDTTDEQPVIHAHRTHEARDQAREMSDEAGLDAYTLKGRKELCPVAAGNFDPGNSMDNPEIRVHGEPISEWLDHKCDRQGLPFSHAHRWAEEEIGGDLPCQRGDTDCSALGQFDNIPRRDNGDPTYDIIHCTHQFLNVPSLRMHTHVFVDEKPSFGIDLTPQEVRESVQAYLEYIDAPVDTYNELVQAAREGKDPAAPDAGTYGGLIVSEHNDSFREDMDEALNGRDERVDCEQCDGEGEIRDGRGEMADLTAYPEHGGATASTACPECNGKGWVVEARGKPPIEWYRNTYEAHALAPAFARAIWRAEESAGGRKHARVPYQPPRWGNDDHDESGWNRVYVDVVLDGDWNVVEVEALPGFSLANSVIGLDAHPQPEDPMWQANVHERMTTNYTLTERERTLYRRYERGLFTVQVGDGVQPVASAEWLDGGQGRKFEAVVEQLREHYGEDFDSAITSASAKAFVREKMREAGVGDPEMMHYGNEESRNDFAGKNVGLVAGSIDPGDAMVVNLCARLDFDVQPCYKECPTCGGTGYVETSDGDDEWCETCDGQGQVRERGRTFEGEDAEKADEVLQGVREHHVAQSAGRWARDADDPEDNATVYIITEAAPDGFIDAHSEGVTWTTSDEQRERLEYVRERGGGATAKEVAEACDCSKTAAWRTLKRAEEEGILERTPGDGPYGADVYSPSEAFTPAGAVDLADADAEVVTEEVKEHYTFTVTVDTLPHCAYNDPEGSDRRWYHQTTFSMLEQVTPPPG